MALRFKTTTGLASSTLDFTGNWLVYSDITIYSVCTLEFISILCSVCFSFHIFLFRLFVVVVILVWLIRNDIVDVFIRSVN